MKYERQLQPATETLWVVSYGGKTIPRRRTAAILKIVISPYLSEKSSDFHEILYTAADFELDERHVIKSEKVALDRRVRQNVFLVYKYFFLFFARESRYIQDRRADLHEIFQDGGKWAVIEMFSIWFLNSIGGGREVQKGIIHL